MHLIGRKKTSSIFTDPTSPYASEEFAAAFQDGPAQDATTTMPNFVAPYEAAEEDARAHQLFKEARLGKAEQQQHQRGSPSSTDQWKPLAGVASVTASTSKRERDESKSKPRHGDDEVIDVDEGEGEEEAHARKPTHGGDGTKPAQPNKKSMMSETPAGSVAAAASVAALKQDTAHEFAEDEWKLRDLHAHQQRHKVFLLVLAFLLLASLSLTLWIWQTNPNHWVTRSQIPSAIDLSGGSGGNGALTVGNSSSGSDLAPHSITNWYMADRSINESNLIDGACSTRALANGSVTVEKLDLASVVPWVDGRIFAAFAAAALPTAVCACNASDPTLFVADDAIRMASGRNITLHANETIALQGVNIALQATNSVTVQTGQGGLHIDTTAAPSSSPGTAPSNGSVVIRTTNLITNAAAGITLIAGVNSSTSGVGGSVPANIDLISYDGRASLVAAELYLESTRRSTRLVSAEDIDLAAARAITLEALQGAISVHGATDIAMRSDGDTSIAAGQSLSLVSSNGSISISSSSSPSADIAISSGDGLSLTSQGSTSISSGTSSPLALVGGAGATFASAGGNTNITSLAGYLDLSGFLGINLRSPGGGSINFYAPTIDLFSNATLACSSASGNATVSSLTGLASLVGYTTLQESFGSGGEATIRSLLGDVRVESVASDVRLQASNGSIQLASQATTIAATDALTVNAGFVSIACAAGGVNVSSSSSSSINLAAGSGVTISSTSGVVALTAPHLVASATATDVDLLAARSIHLAAQQGGVTVDTLTSIVLESRASDITLAASNGTFSSASSRIDLAADQAVSIASAAGSIGIRARTDASVTATDGNVTLAALAASVNLVGSAGVSVLSPAGPVQIAAPSSSIGITAGHSLDLQCTSGDVYVGSRSGALKLEANGVGAAGGIALLTTSTAGVGGNISLASSAGISLTATGAASDVQLASARDATITAARDILLSSPVGGGSILSSARSFAFQGTSPAAITPNAVLLAAPGAITLNSSASTATVTGAAAALIATTSIATVASSTASVVVSAATDVSVSGGKTVRVQSEAALFLAGDGSTSVGATLATQQGDLALSSAASTNLLAQAKLTASAALDVTLLSGASTNITAAAALTLQSQRASISITAASDITTHSSAGTITIESLTGAVNVSAPVARLTSADAAITSSTLQLTGSSAVQLVGGSIDIESNLKPLTLRANSADLRASATNGGGVAIDSSANLNMTAADTASLISGALAVKTSTGGVDLASATSIHLRAASGDISASASGNVTISALAATSLRAAGNVQLHSDATMGLDGANVNVTSVGDLNLAASSGSISISAPLTKLTGGAVQLGETAIPLTPGQFVYTIDFSSLVNSVLRFTGSPGGVVTLAIAHCDQLRSGIDVKLVNACANTTTDVLLLSKPTCMDLFSSSISVGNFVTLSCLGSAPGTASTDKAFCTRPAGGAAGIVGVNATGTIQQGTPGVVQLNAAAGQVTLVLTSIFPNYQTSSFWLLNDHLMASHVGITFTPLYSGSTGALIVTSQKLVPGYGALCTVMNVGMFLNSGETIAFVFQLI